MNQKEDYIGVFDSGVGGISVLRQLVKLMPQETFLYYGDSANAPYGTRTTGQVRELTLRAAEKLMARGLKALVIACNTATAAAIEDLRSTYPDTIIIGIEPALKLASDHFPQGRVGVMATSVTLREEKFRHLMDRCADHCRVYPIPAPGLVELIEQGEGTTDKTLALLTPILSPYVGKLDALVLGCTHYPFAAKTIRHIMGDSIQLLDGGEGTARETLRRLKEKDLLAAGTGQVILENSSPDPALIRLSHTLLQQDSLSFGGIL